MGKKTLLQLDQEIKIDKPEQEEVELIVSDFGKSPPKKHHHHHDKSEDKEQKPQAAVQKEAETEKKTEQ